MILLMSCFVISAIISGAEGWRDIETYGNSKADWLRQHRPFANGIPRRHTIARILRCIVIDTLFEALLCWVNEQRTHQGKPIIAFLMARCYAVPFGEMPRMLCSWSRPTIPKMGWCCHESNPEQEGGNRNRQRDAGHS